MSDTKKKRRDERRKQRKQDSEIIEQIEDLLDDLPPHRAHALLNYVRDSIGPIPPPQPIEGPPNGVHPAAWEALQRETNG